MEFVSAPIEGDLGEESFYHDQQNLVLSGMVELGAMTASNLRRAGAVVTENRLDEVGDVVAADGAIDELAATLNEQVFTALALQQTMARDLRVLVAANRMLYEIERSADLAVNLVQTIERIDGVPHDLELGSRLEELVDAALAMFDRGLEALATMDPTIGETAEAEDDLTDERTIELFDLVRDKQSEIGLEAGVALFYLGRFLERIADHGVNIALEVRYATAGTDPAEAATDNGQ